MRALKHAKRLLDLKLYDRAKYDDAVQRADDRMEQFLQDKTAATLDGQEIRGELPRPRLFGSDCVLVRGAPLPKFGMSSGAGKRQQSGTPVFDSPEEYPNLTKKRNTGSGKSGSGIASAGSTETAKAPQYKAPSWQRLPTMPKPKPGETSRTGSRRSTSSHMLRRSRMACGCMTRTRTPIGCILCRIGLWPRSSRIRLRTLIYGFGTKPPRPWCVLYAGIQARSRRRSR